MQRSLLLFENSIHSKETLKSYKYALDKFIEYFKLRDYDSLANMESKMLQEMVEDYVIQKKSDGLSRGSIGMAVNANTCHARAVYSDFSLDAGDTFVVRATELQQNGTL